jgi:hypothetical protein
MHESFWRRLEAIEKTRGLRLCAATRIISIVFAGMEATFVEGPGGFVSYRRADEDLLDFEARANPHYFSTA